MTSEKTSFDDIKIVSYSEKCFVVCGETRTYRESLRVLGGKWNSSLTNKETGEKFGGWIFPATKLSQVKQWKMSGEHLHFTDMPLTAASSASTSSCARASSSPTNDGDEVPTITNVFQKMVQIENRLSKIEYSIGKILAQLSDQNGSSVSIKTTPPPSSKTKTTKPASISGASSTSIIFAEDSDQEDGEPKPDVNHRRLL